MSTATMTLDKASALAEARSRLESQYGIKLGVDEVVNLAGRLLLEQAGVQPGSRIRILTGKYRGREFEVECVAWSEAEVKVLGPGWADGRWFSLWFHPEFEVVA